MYEEVKRLSIPMDRVCFNTLLSIYVKMERYEDVVRTSEEMERLGIDRDVVTYNGGWIWEAGQIRGGRISD